MLGFAIPLLVLGGILTIIAILLLSPPPFDKPAVLLCRATKTSAGMCVVDCTSGNADIMILACICRNLSAGWTVVATLSTVLAAMSASPLWDVMHMKHHARETSADNLQRR